jgi:uridine kinase
MTHDEFNQLVNKRVNKCKKVLLSKADEYATDDERLQNFKDGAIFNYTTPECYALSLITKHLMSLRDYIVLREDHITQEFIDEKIGDIHNYMYLLEAILTEKL